MALFGRETSIESRRAERVGRWARQRHPYSLAAVLFGILAIVDSWTMVIGLVAGVAAITFGTLGLRALAHQPRLRGRRLSKVGIGMGALGIAMSLAIYLYLHGTGNG